LLLIPHLIYLNLAAIIAIIDYNITLIAKVRGFIFPGRKSLPV